MFKGEMITIGPGEHIEMDWEEAIEFKGQFTGIKRLPDDSPDPRGFKKIRVEAPQSPVFKDDLVNHANGQSFLTKDDLQRSLAMFSHLRAPGDVEQQQQPSISVEQYNALMAEMAEMKKQMAKKSPGRPKKETYEQGAE